MRPSDSLQLTRAALAALLLLAAFVTPARAQWPTVLMLHGGTLKSPVLATGADSVAFAEIFRSGPSAGPRPTFDQMKDRPYLGVACFWGPLSDPAMNGTSLADLKPEMAWQRGRFFPATATEPAAMFVAVQVKGRDIRAIGQPTVAAPAMPSFPLGGLVPQAALDVLKRLGVPVAPVDSSARKGR